MNEMLMMLMLGNRGIDRSRLAAYLRDERSRKEKDYAKIARLGAFAAFYFWGGLKLEYKNATGTIPATDPAVPVNSKIDAVLKGIEETYRAMPFFTVVNEAATWIGEVVARSTTPDPALIELMTANSAPQTISVNPSPMYSQPRTLTITSPNGQTGRVQLTANGIQIDDPNWGVRVD